MGDVEEVLSHEFFKGIDIDALMRKGIQAEFIPLIDSTGINNFDRDITNQKPEESMIPKENIAMIMQYQEHFKEFSYSESQV